MKSNKIANAFAAALFGVQSLIFANPVSAQPEEAVKKPQPRVSLLLTGLSRHFGDRSYTEDRRNRTFNEVNPGGALEWRFNEHVHMRLGAYRNSVREVSGALLFGLETRGDRFLGVGVEGGMVSGYEKVSGGHRIVPAGAALVRFGKRENINFVLEVIPAGKRTTVVGAGLRIPAKSLIPDF